MNKAPNTTTTTTTTAQTTFINQSKSKSNSASASFPESKLEPESRTAVDPPSYPYPSSHRAKAFYIDIPTPSPTRSSPTTPTLESGHEYEYEMGSSKHSHGIAHDEWAGPIPSSTMRNSMSFQRPAFVHTTTNYHSQQSLNASASAGASTSSLPLQQSTPATYNVQGLGQGAGAGAGTGAGAGPYRDHIPTTKEEYPNSDPTTNPYAQAFPPRAHTPSRRHVTSAHSRQSSFGAWESVCCRLADVRRRMCCKEGALGRALMIGWVLTTVGFLLACAFWKGELFTALDDLSKQLYSLGYQGQLIFGLLIFITTIPPLPLYSTLMVLCGYTFGVWEAFVVSYIASLIGAVVVFVVSRTLLRDVITKSLQNSPMAMSLLHIIPAKPHLLLLIRVAPYPYNLLNVILASSPSLTLRAYTACTALSLCKLFIHTWIGAGLHDLSELHGGGAGHGNGNGDGSSLSMEDQQRQDVRWYSTCFGVVLCISLFLYLTHLAKRAVARAQLEHEAREIRCPGQGHVFLREEDA